MARSSPAHGGANSAKRPLTRREKSDFLLALEQGFSIFAAAKKAAPTRDRNRFYELRKLDEAFAEAWDAAVEAGTDVLEDEARRRAFQGTEKPVYQGGKLVGTVQEFSDTLLMFLLNGRRPEKFKRTDRVEITGSRGGPIQVEGRAVVGLADVVQLARELGAGHLVGVDAGDPRGELPAAPEVLPAPGDGQ